MTENEVVELARSAFIEAFQDSSACIENPEGDELRFLVLFADKIESKLIEDAAGYDEWGVTE